MPLPLQPKDISNYLELNESPVEVWILSHVVFSLDNEYLDEQHENMKNKKPSK